MKILVAEDDAKMAEYVSKGLVAEGHTVDCVADGREALSLNCRPRNLAYWKY